MPVRPKAKEVYRPLGMERLEDRAFQAGDLGNAIVNAPYVDVADNTTQEISTVLSAGDAGGQNNIGNVTAEGEAE